MSVRLLVGDTVQLVMLGTPSESLPSGTIGVVFAIDDLGTIHVAWENGSTLGLIPEVDIFRKIQNSSG